MVIFTNYTSRFIIACVSDVKVEDQDSGSSMVESPVKVTSAPLEADIFAPGAGIGAEELMKEFERRSPSVSAGEFYPT